MEAGRDTPSLTNGFNQKYAVVMEVGGQLLVRSGKDEDLAVPLLNKGLKVLRRLPTVR